MDGAEGCLSASGRSDDDVNAEDRVARDYKERTQLFAQYAWCLWNQLHPTLGGATALLCALM